ncbi:MAG: SHOCT domain-containing protein [Aquihabitans sp.]
MLASDFGTGQVFWSLLWFTILVIWVYLLIVIFTDVFRSKDLSGFAKFLWVLFVFVLPYIGVFAYLIIRGHKMHEHAAADAQAADAAAQAYIRQAAAGTGTGVAGEIGRLADLRTNGVITEAEFQKRKAQLLDS